MSQPEPASSPPTLPAPSRKRRRLFFALILLLLVLCASALLLWQFNPSLINAFPGNAPAIIAQLASGNSSTETYTPTNTSLPSPSAPFTPTATQPPIATSTLTPASPTAPPAIPNTPSAGAVILSALDKNHYHLFVFLPETNSFLRLTDGQWEDITPSVSPDGKRLAFASNRSGFWDIYVMDLNSGEVSPLTTSPEYDASPSWSPDGKWIVYQSYVIHPATGEGNFEIYIHSVTDSSAQDAGQALQLTDHPGADFFPVWSPTGRQIAFVSQRDGENDIWLADLDKVENRFTNLSRNPHASDRHPQWSPDGRWLVWDSRLEGIPYIYYWDATAPQTPAEPRIPGEYPLLADQGKILFVEVSTPNRSYLTAYDTAQFEPLIPFHDIYSPLQGLTWLANGLPASFPDLMAQSPSLPDWQAEINSASPLPSNRQNIVPLTDVNAPYPYLHDLVNESFQAFRSTVNQLAGWDYLSKLENAYIPLTSPPLASINNDWLYTGRAFALHSGALNSGWLVTVREEFGSEVYWHIYLKTRFQDGSQGQPLQDLPWDINARYKGDPLAYEQGGAYFPITPAGYYIDLTELGRRYGWERLPALASWRLAAPASRYNLFLSRDNLTWYDAMLQLYPPQALYTATPPPPPTATPTKAPFPSRTPTPTHTPPSTGTSPAPTQTP